jgi:hypothetical protein
MDENKKAAALAAVMAYIKEEEEIACALAMQPQSGIQGPQVSPQLSINIWGLSGRQTQMQMRNMMQLKTFHSIRS